MPLIHKSHCAANESGSSFPISNWNFLLGTSNAQFLGEGIWSSWSSLLICSPWVSLLQLAFGRRMMDRMRMWPPRWALSVGAVGDCVVQSPIIRLQQGSTKNPRSVLYKWPTTADFAYLALSNFPDGKDCHFPTQLAWFSFPLNPVYTVKLNLLLLFVWGLCLSN